MNNAKHAAAKARSTIQALCVLAHPSLPAWQRDEVYQALQVALADLVTASGVDGPSQGPVPDVRALASALMADPSTCDEVLVSNFGAVAAG